MGQPRLVAGILPLISLVAALCCDSLSAQSTNRFAGTWVLNPAKSTYKPGPPPKSGVLRVDYIGNRRRSVLETITADGGRARSEYEAPLDGKDYPITGSASADTVALRQAAPGTIERTDKRKGQIVMLVTIRLSSNDNVLTVTQKGVTTSAGMIDNTIVYERQQSSKR
jgi:hypothetical protein